MIFNINNNWKFKKQNSEKYEIVSLPHDAMLTESRTASCHNSKQSGYFPGGKYIYEKTVEFTDEDLSKKIKLFFEGVYQNCKIYINDLLLGSHKYGYTEFEIDITSFAECGENIIRVEVDNSLEPNCRWYSGSGIYRSVWLKISKKDLYQPKIITKTISPAVIEIDADNECTVEIYDNDTLIASGQSGEFEIENAKLWSDETPYLYKCVCRFEDEQTETMFGIRKLEWNNKNGLTVNGKRVLLRGGCIHHDNGVLGACGFADAEERRVRILKQAGYNAIRSAHNPMSRAMLDACDRLGMYVMDECFDGWYTPKNYHDYSRYFETEWRSDLQSMVNKDFNHPCVIIYSVGNEVSETATPKGVDCCKALVDYMHILDDSRPVTAGVNVLLNVYANLGLGVYKEKGTYKAEPLPPKSKNYKEKKTGSAFFNAAAQKLGGLMFFMSKGKKGDNACKGAAEHLDVIGLNYAGSRIEEDVQKYPNRLMIASETMVTDLPYNWERVKKYPQMLGDFVWASWDYLGEAIVGDWTYYSYKGLPLLAGSGTIDITGKITAEAYYQQVIWGLRKEPYICVRPLNHIGEMPRKSAWRFTNAIESWSWHGYEGKKAVVEVFSDADSIRLELNGNTVAQKKLKKYKTLFSIPYESGTLTAVALDKSGGEISRYSLKSGGTETKLTAIPDKKILKADGQSLCFIPIEFTDANGELKPYIEQSVNIKVEGAATLQGFGSALCKTNESYLSDSFYSFRGRVFAVIRAGTNPGKATVTISSSGVDKQIIELEVQ
ncbi:MAG: DUF4982 domain-containing protein [Acetobacter sp.]|nr:DUF4982 domain-containing protein [Bacteroides sp.]MCM1340639.1 DUF4982 domain-containing protein [Acetobacter sp.]MCM1433750.1 DUF4982 domain-containing protein [Clostridiales bacterium]